MNTFKEIQCQPWPASALTPRIVSYFMHLPGGNAECVAADFERFKEMQPSIRGVCLSIHRSKWNNKQIGIVLKGPMGATEMVYKEILTWKDLGKSWDRHFLSDAIWQDILGEPDCDDELQTLRPQEQFAYDASEDFGDTILSKLQVNQGITVPWYGCSTKDNNESRHNARFISYQKDDTMDVESCKIQKEQANTDMKGARQQTMSHDQQNKSEKTIENYQEQCKDDRSNVSTLPLIYKHYNSSEKEQEDTSHKQHTYEQEPLQTNEIPSTPSIWDWVCANDKRGQMRSKKMNDTKPTKGPDSSFVFLQDDNKSHELQPSLGAWSKPLKFVASHTAAKKVNPNALNSRPQTKHLINTYPQHEQNPNNANKDDSEPNYSAKVTGESFQQHELGQWTKAINARS